MLFFIPPSKAHSINMNGSNWPIKEEKKRFTFTKLGSVYGHLFLLLDYYFPA